MFLTILKAAIKPAGKILLGILETGLGLGLAIHGSGTMSEGASDIKDSVANALGKNESEEETSEE